MSTEKVLRITAVLLALIGLVLLLQSTVWGLQAVPGIIQRLGSVSGDFEHQVVYQGPAAALRMIGAILLGVGLYRALEPFKKV